MISKKIVDDLESIVNAGLDKIDIPYQKGNSIRIRNFIIRKNKDGYLVLNFETKEHIATTNFKTTAVAIVKNLIKGKNIISSALEYDRSLLKYYNDALFYKHFIKSNRNTLETYSRKVRLEDAIEKTKHIKNQLDNYIY